MAEEFPEEGKLLSDKEPTVGTSAPSLFSEQKVETSKKLHIERRDTLESTLKLHKINTSV